MKILGINCSPRINSTTGYCLSKALEKAGQNKGIEIERIDLSGKAFEGCKACDYCRSSFDCSQNDDFRNEIFPLLADENLKGLIIATPVYFGSMSAQCKAFIDRTLPFRRNGFILKDKVVGVIAVGGSRNGGQEITIQSVQAAFLIHDCIIVSDGFNTAHFGGMCWQRHPGGIQNDDTGLKTVENLGQKVAELVLKINK